MAETRTSYRSKTTTAIGAVSVIWPEKKGWPGGTGFRDGVVEIPMVFEAHDDFPEHRTGLGIAHPDRLEDCGMVHVFQPRAE